MFLRTYFFYLISLLLIFTNYVNSTCQQYSVAPAFADPSLTSFTGGFIIYIYDTSLTNGEAQFIFDPNSQVNYQLSSTGASIEGRLVGKDSGNSNNGFDFQLTLLNSNQNYSGMVEFFPSVQVDTSTWLFLTIGTPSTLSGFGAYSGLQFTIIQQKTDFPFQVGLGANGKNMNFGAATWFTLVSADGNTRINGDLNVDINLNGCPSLCPSANNMTASAAKDDSYANFTGGVAFSFFDAPASIGNNYWVFSANSGEFIVNGDQVHLSGIIHPAYDGNSDATFTVNLLFVAAPTSFQPMLHKELIPSAYIENGGPVDASKWSYYFLDSASSRISNNNGVVITLSTFMDMPLQVGIGANGKNINFGASGWFNYLISGDDTTVYKMDINLDLDCPDFMNSDCQVSTSVNLRTSWLDNNKNVSLWDITLTNTGIQTVLDANVQIIFPSDVDCSVFPEGSCIRGLWNLDQTSQGGYHLPSWLTEWNKLPVGSSHVFGIISLDTGVKFAVQPVCK